MYLFLATDCLYWVDLIYDLFDSFYVMPIGIFLVRQMADFVTQCMMIAIFYRLIEVMQFLK